MVHICISCEFLELYNEGSHIELSSSIILDTNVITGINLAGVRSEWGRICLVSVHGKFPATLLQFINVLPHSLTVGFSTKRSVEDEKVGLLELLSLRKQLKN